MSDAVVGGSRGARPRRGFVMLAAVAALALAALAGTWAGTVATPPEPAPPAPPPPERIVQAGPAQLLAPGAWRSIPVERSGVAGFESGDAVAFTVRSRPSVRIIAEFGPAADGSLLPPGLRALAPEIASPMAGTRLGGQRAALYSDVALGESTRADITLMATTEGVLAIACTAGGTAATTGYDCASKVRAAAVPGASTLVPASSLPLSLALPPVVDRLDRDRRTHRAALARAAFGEPQARAAGRLAAAHASAAATLRPVAGETGQPLLAGLTRTRYAYAKLERAAANRWRSRFAAFREPVRRAETALVAAIAAIPVAESAGPPAHIEPAPAPAPAATTVIPTPGGISPLLFAILALIAAIAGVVLGTAGAAPRLLRPATDAARRFRAS